VILVATGTTARAEGGADPVPSTSIPCEPGWVARVYKSARPSVVRIEDAKGIGTGFVVFSPRYVATALHVVALGRTLTVTSADGSQQGATVVVTDALHDLALLELEHPIRDATPLAASSLPSPVGTPVVVIGHPFALLNRADRNLEGLLDWTATEGIVSERNDALLQTDAAVNPGNSGGPMLACDGQVLGLVTAKVSGEGIGLAVPMAGVDALELQIGKQSPYTGRWSTEGQVYVQGELERSYSWLGFGIGAVRIAHDRWSTGLRIGVLWTASTPGTSPAFPTYVANGPVLSSTGVRGSSELDEMYRLLLQEHPFPVYMQFGLGVAATLDRLSQTTLAQTAVSGCAPQGSAGCQIIVGLDTHQTNFMFWPMAHVGFVLARIEITYAFQANVQSLADSEHRLLLGVRF
jgi:S1-C subfamily serine protease